MSKVIRMTGVELGGKVVCLKEGTDLVKIIKALQSGDGEQAISIKSRIIDKPHLTSDFAVQIVKLDPEPQQLVWDILTEHGSFLGLFSEEELRDIIDEWGVLVD